MKDYRAALLMVLAAFDGGLMPSVCAQQDEALPTIPEPAAIDTSESGSAAPDTLPNAPPNAPLDTIPDAALDAPETGALAPETGKDPEQIQEPAALQAPAAPIEPIETEIIELEGQESWRMDYEKDPRVPAYQRARPDWALTLLASVGQSYVRATTFGLGFEWMPITLQRYGVFSIGVSLFKHEPMSGSGIKMGFLDFFGGAGSIRYQLRYFREQPIVPVVGYEFHYLSFTPEETSTRQSTTLSGPVFGAMLLLNFIDPGAAASFFSDVGVIRTYLFGEMRMLSSSAISIKSPSIFGGVRFEF